MKDTMKTTLTARAPMTTEQYRKRLEQRRREQNNGLTFNPEIHSTEKDSRYLNGWRWIEQASKGLRVVGPVHKYRNTNPQGNQRYVDYALVNHTGWFTDEHQDETVFGVILQLPSRHGETQYVPAISDPNNDDCYLANFHDWDSDVIEVLRSADSMAETYAEHEREYRTLESAKCRIEQLQDELKTARANRRDLVRELRANCARLAGLPQVRAALRAHIVAIKADARKTHAEIQKLTNDPYSIAY